MQLVRVYLLFLLAQLLLQVTYCVHKSSCPECGGDGWIRLDDDPFCYNHTQFPLTDNTKNFDALKKYCQGEEASLPILKTDGERERFKSLDFKFSGVKRNCLNLGLYKIASSNEWMWIDNTTVTLNEMNNLLSGTGDASSFDSGAIYYNIKYRGFYHTALYKFCRDVYCQKHCPLVTSTAQGGDEYKESKQTESPSGLGLGPIIGIAVGGVLLLLLIGTALVLLKKKRAAGMRKTPGDTDSAVTAKDEPGAGIATKDLFGATEAEQTGIETKDLFGSTEVEQTGIGTKDLFNSTEADNASNASLNLSSVDK